MNTTLRNKLLVGTALVATGVFMAGAAQAQVAQIDTTGDGTFDTTLNNNDSIVSGNLEILTSGSTVVLNTNVILGNAGGNGGEAITTSLTGTEQFTIEYSANTPETLTITGDISKGAADGLSLTFKADGTNPQAFAIDQTIGNIDLGTGTLTLEATGLGKSVDFSTNASTINADNVVLTDSTAQATLVLNGAADQTINAVVKGGNNDNGVLSVTNTGGEVTFTKVVGTATNKLNAINIGGTADTANVEFQDDVHATAITVGQNTAGAANATFKGNVTANVALGVSGSTVTSNSVTFDASGGNRTVTGAISGGATTDTNTINVLGGNVVSFTGADSVTNLDVLNVNGTNTKLTTDQNLTVAKANVAAGATLAVTDAKTLTFANGIENKGTISLAGIGAVLAANVTGTGTTSIGANATITGNVTQSKVNFTGDHTLTIAAGTRTFDTDFTTNADNTGVITINNGGSTININGKIGESGGLLKAFNTGTGTQVVNLKGDLWATNTNLEADSTLKFIGGTQAVAGTIDGLGGAGRGTITVGNGTDETNVTFVGAVGATNTLAAANVLNESSATFSNDVAVAGNFINDGTVTLAGTNAVLAVAGSFINDGTVTLAGIGAELDADVTGTGTTSIGANATITGNVTQSKVNFTGDHTLTIAAGTRTFDTDFTTNADNTGVITINNGGSTININGKIGESGGLLKAFNTGTGTQVVNLKGDLWATNTNLEADSTLKFIGGTQAVAGTIDGLGGAGRGTITVGNGTDETNVTFVGAVGATNTLAAANVLNESSATFSNDVAVAGNFINDGTVTLAGTNAVLAVAGSFINDGTVTLAGIGAELDADVTGTGTTSIGANATITGNVTQSKVNFTGDHTLTIAAGTRTFDTDFTTNADNTGVITINNGGSTININGKIGESGGLLKAFNTGTGTQVVNLKGDLWATNTKLALASTLKFIGGTQAVAGTIDGLGGAGRGTITVGDGIAATNVTFNGAVGATYTLAAANVLKASSATFSNDVAVAGSFINNGTVTVAQGKTLTAGAFATGDAVGTYNITIGTDADGVDNSATLVSNNKIDFNLLNGTTPGGAKLNLTQGTGFIANNQPFKIVDGDVADVDGLGTTLVNVDNTFALFDFKVRTGDPAVLAGTDAKDVIAIATHNLTADGVITVSANQSTANAILGITAKQYNAADPNFKLLYDTVSSASKANINNVLEAVRPELHMAGVAAATSVTRQTTSLANTQLASLRDGSESGMYAGSASGGLRAWLQGFGQTADQSTRKGIAGYEADSYGVAVGFDTSDLAKNWVLGLMFAYGNSDIDSKSVNRTTTDIDSYQLGLYSSYNFDSATYLTGQLGYIWMSNDQIRRNVPPGVNAKGDFDSYSVYARLEAGRGYNVGGDAVVTPKFLVNYQHYNADSYTETLSGGAGLNVSADSINIFELGVGADVKWNLRQADGAVFQPKFSAGVRHDLIGDEFKTTNSFIGVPSVSFTTRGADPAQTTYNLGAALTYFSAANWQLSAAYDYEAKADFNSHTGSLKASFKF